MDESAAVVVSLMRDRADQNTTTHLFFQSGRRPENGAGYPNSLRADMVEVEALRWQITPAADFTATALFFLNDECSDQGAPALPTALLSVLNRWNHGG
jgi:hypothetical protein